MPPSTSSKVTTDRDVIRHWAEERGAKPALIAKNDGEPGKVRLEFPGSRDQSLREISWDEWFEQFNKSELALLYQQQTPDGEHSCFCRIMRREKADEVERAVGGRGRSAARRGSPGTSKPVRLRTEEEGENCSQPGAGLRSASDRKAAGKNTILKPQTARGRGQQISS